MTGLLRTVFGLKLESKRFTVGSRCLENLKFGNFLIVIPFNAKTRRAQLRTARAARSLSSLNQSCYCFDVLSVQLPSSCFVPLVGSLRS